MLGEFYMQIVLRDVVKDFLKRNAKHKIECDNIDELLDENFVEVKITEMYSALKDGQTGFIQRYRIVSPNKIYIKIKEKNYDL